MQPDFPGAETTLHSESIFDGLLLKVRRDTVQLPDGEQATREWIDHPGAAAVVPLLNDGTILMVRQYRYAARQFFLEVPAGKNDTYGENPIHTATRELEEETGWRAGSMSYLGYYYMGIGFSNECIHFYLATELEQGQQNLEHDEFVTVERIPKDELFAKNRAGELTDIKTAMALRLAEEYLDSLLSH